MKSKSKRQATTSRRFGSGLAAVALTAGVLGGAVALAPPAAAATPVCNTTTTAYFGNNTYSLYPYYKSPNAITCLMYQGIRGPEVRALQKNLNKCYGKRLTLDGVFGPKTKSALRDVQSRVGVVADGVYGPRTRNAMKWAHYSIETGARVYCATFNT